MKASSIFDVIYTISGSSLIGCGEYLEFKLLVLVVIMDLIIGLSLNYFLNASEPNLFVGETI